jgi:hypothetical protein
MLKKILSIFFILSLISCATYTKEIRKNDHPFADFQIPQRPLTPMEQTYQNYQKSINQYYDTILALSLIKGRDGKPLFPQYYSLYPSFYYSTSPYWPLSSEAYWYGQIIKDELENQRSMVQFDIQRLIDRLQDEVRKAKEEIERAKERR